MKVSISLRDEDVAFLDAYAKEAGLGSRSAAAHAAVRALRDAQLESEYEQAFADWDKAGEGAFWSDVDLEVPDEVEDGA